MWEGKFVQNGKFGQNCKLGHSCTNVTKGRLLFNLFFSMKVCMQLNMDTYRTHNSVGS